MQKHMEDTILFSKQIGAKEKRAEKTEESKDQ